MRGLNRLALLETRQHAQGTGEISGSLGPLDGL